MPVIFGEPLIILAPCFQSLPFQTVLKSCIVKRQQVCSEFQAIYSAIMWKSWFQPQLSLHSFYLIQLLQLPQFINFFFPRSSDLKIPSQEQREERDCAWEVSVIWSDDEFLLKCKLMLSVSGISLWNKLSSFPISHSFSLSKPCINQSWSHLQLVKK